MVGILPAFIRRVNPARVALGAREHLPGTDGADLLHPDPEIPPQASAQTTARKELDSPGNLSPHGSRGWWIEEPIVGEGEA